MPVHCMNSSFRPQAISDRLPEKPVTFDCKKPQIRPTLEGVSDEPMTIRPPKQLDGCCWFDREVLSSLSELKTSSTNNTSDR